MRTIPASDAQAIAIVGAIQSGDVEALQRQLRAVPDLATVRIVDERGVSRTLLHVAADWPGHFPNGRAIVTTLIAAGAHVNAALTNPNQDAPETALHAAASSNDLEVIDALLDGGADIEAPGAVFTGGTAMSDAVIFAQWNAARRLLERGATTTLSQSAALGLYDRVVTLCAQVPAPASDVLTGALWHACRGGQRAVAEYLLQRGADLNWIGWDHKTPLDAAHDSGATDLIEWLVGQGAKRARG